MKLDFDKLAGEFLDAGMSKVRVKELVKQIKQDMIDWPDVYENWELCEWALERGFLPGRVRLYGSAFNEETYLNYYNDFSYFMDHPLNNHFAIWINDKLTLKYMLDNSELSKYMPEYYLYIENDGEYTYLMDAPKEIERNENFLYNLLLHKGKLAMKPNRGAGGFGFLGLKYENGNIYKNGKVITEEEFRVLKENLNGYIVTEYIDQAEEMEKVYPSIACALRITLFKKVKEKKEDNSEYRYLLGYGRFATDKNEAASNNDQGGLAITIDWDKGIYKGNFRGITHFWGKEGMEGLKKHPNTGIELDGKAIPNWDIVKKGLLDICQYLSSLDYFGMDVIITEDGFKLCEINSAPSVGRGQYYYGRGCLENAEARRFAEKKKRTYKKNFIECFKVAMQEG